MSTATLLLHPLGVDRRFWEPLRASWPDPPGELLSPDLPGHGTAALPPAGNSIDGWMEAVLPAIGGRGRVHVVGVSLGGLVAQVLAARRPDLVDRVVLLDTVATYPEPMRAMWRARATSVRARGMAEVVEATETLWFTPGFRDASPAAVHRVRDRLLTIAPEGYARACELLAEVDVSDEASSIAGAVLVGCGRHDAPPFRAAVPWFEDHLADARTAWLGGAHASAYERPEELAALLADFLGSAHRLDAS